MTVHSSFPRVARPITQPCFRTLPLAALLATLATTAAADILIDPAGTGASHVSPNPVSNPNSTSQITVGYLSSNGAVEVNANTNSNGLTSFSGGALLIGRDGATGSVRIVGNGSPNSAHIDIVGDGVGLRNGFGGNGSLYIENGGVLSSAPDIYLGNQGLSSTPGTALTVIDGAGSTLRTQRSTTGESWERYGGTIHVGFNGVSDSTVVISNGGSVEALNGGTDDPFDAGQIYIGWSANAGSTATVDVTGAGSTLYSSNFLAVGSATTNVSAQLNVSNGGSVAAGESTLVAAYAGSAAITVSGSGSTLTTGAIQLGADMGIYGFTSDGTPVTNYDSSLAIGAQVRDPQGNAVYDRDGNPVLGVDFVVNGQSYGFAIPSTYYDDLKVKRTGSLLVEDGAEVYVDGRVDVGNNSSDPLATTFNGEKSVLTIRDGAELHATEVVLNQDSLLNGDGTIYGNVLLNGGEIAPGNSPGRLTIFGDLTIADGTLSLEVNGFDQDVIDVKGTFTLGSDVNIQFVLGEGFGGTSLQLLDFLFADMLSIDGGFDPASRISVVALQDSNVGVGTDFEVLVGGNSYIVQTVGEVPLPAGVWLFGSALAGLAVARRRAA